MSYKFLNSRISDAERLVAELSDTYGYVSVLGSYTHTKRIVSSTRETAINDIDNELGFVIKAYRDGHYSEYSCNDIRELDKDELIRALDIAVEGAISVPMIEEEEHSEAFERKDPNPLCDEEIVERLEKIRKGAESKKKVINVFANFSKREVSKFFVSKKKKLTQSYDWINCMMAVVTKDGSNIQQNYSAEGEADSVLCLKKLEENADSIADIAVKLLEATPIEPGVYDIITDHSISGLIAHEAFGHGVEMDMFVKGRAKAKDYVGKRVASDLVDMYDGAAGCVSAASYFFDDDGVMAHRTQIIDKGILKTGISDALSALELGSEPTGNGRRESYSHKAYTRMTNTYFGAGKDKLEDIIASISHGYYLCQTSNGMEDPKNWQIQCTASYGLEIRDGKFTGKIVAPVIISGYVIDLLESISMVSDELKIIGSGMCGKGHKEWVYVSDGGPHLKARAKLG